MKKRTVEEWQTLFAEHTESGLSAAAFCRERGLCPKYFSLRRRQLGDREPSKSKPAFVPASILSLPVELAVQIQLSDDLQLRIPAAVSPHWLATLLIQLRA